MTLVVFIVSLLGAMAIGVPVAFSLMFCGVILMWYMGMFNTQIIAQNMIAGADTFTLLAIPFFILAGELMNAGGLSRRIIDFAIACVGHIRGGLGIVAIMAAVIMASISGSAAADTAALAAILIPMMAKAGYNVPRSAGLIAAGGIIAPRNSAIHGLHCVRGGGKRLDYAALHGRHRARPHHGYCPCRNVAAGRAEG